MHCCRWMSSFIQYFHWVPQTLGKIPEDAYKISQTAQTTLKGYRTCQDFLGPTTRTGVYNSEKILQSAVQLTHLKNYVILVITDASDQFCAGVVEQVKIRQNYKRRADTEASAISVLVRRILKSTGELDHVRERSSRNSKGCQKVVLNATMPKPVTNIYGP